MELNRDTTNTLFADPTVQWEQLTCDLVHDIDGDDEGLGRE